MNKINDFQLQEINKVIEVLTAYKEGKTIEYNAGKDGWLKCYAAPAISIVSTHLYRIADKQENIETHEE